MRRVAEKHGVGQSILIKTFHEEDLPVVKKKRAFQEVEWRKQLFNQRKEFRGTMERDAMGCLRNGKKYIRHL